jgi:hypothetical protein
MAGSKGKSHCQIEELLMKKFILLTVFINLSIFTACSSETSGTKPVNTTNGNTANVNTANVNATNNNFIVVNMDNPPNNNGDFNIDKAVNRKVTNAPANYKEPGAVEMGAMPAPYNSTIKTVMNKQNEFLETREFKGDPLLLRVERTQQTKKIKVFLKNGKVVNLPYEKNDLFLGASPNEILTAAGITPPTVKPADGDQKKIPSDQKKQ